uniref:amidase n=1 Tax=Herbaspirillum lusitanum TaxID=213312 RepID=UPI000369016D
MSKPALSWKEWGRLDAVALAELVRTRQVSAAETVAQAVEAARLLEPQLGAVLETFDNITSAPSADGANPDGALWGVPLFIKDLGSTIGGRLAENGSALNKDKRSARTDPLIANLHRAGLISVGRSTTAELGMTYDTTTTYRGLKVTRNPWNPDYTPGGSSGGSAALVAAGVTPLAHSTDGAGSTRIPASLTGLIGLKVSRGRLPLPWSFNEYGNATIGEGTFSRTVRDTAAFLDAAASDYPAGNSFVSGKSPTHTFASALQRAPGKLRIARARTREVAAALQELGHEVEEIDDSIITDWDRFWPSFRTFWLGMRPAMWGLPYEDGIPPELLEQLAPMTRKFWLNAQRYDKRDVLRHQAGNNAHALRLGEFFGKYDALLAPAFAIPAPKANGPFSLANDRDFDAYINELLDAGRYAIPASEAGLPAVSLP